MKRKTLISLIVLVSVILLAEFIFLGYMAFQEGRGDPLLNQQTVPTETEDTQTIPATEETVATEPVETTEATEPTETEPPETEPPQPESFLLTFTGDCTFGGTPARVNAETGFLKVVGDNYDYPFQNVRQYFENDDYTLINLEQAMGDKGYPVDKKWTFRGPAEYTQVMTGSSVEFVTIANNHSYDFGKEGYEQTREILEEAGIVYTESYKSVTVTTERGLTIAIYAVDASLNAMDKEQMVTDITQLKESGVEVIIAAFHWGYENNFRSNPAQQELGKAAIDAGANIVWGHHPHVLQPIEEYNGGIIYYSLGNFAFGGNSVPKDHDTAVLQQELIREPDGSIHLGKLTIIPCSVSSIKERNNFQPTPYEEGSEEYKRVLSKLDGTYGGPNLAIG